MRFRTKRTIVRTVLVVLAAWPFAHMAVVRATGMSPWRGAGWAMYTVPELDVAVGVRPIAGDAAPRTAGGQDAVLAATTRFIRRRQALGPRTRPDGVADAVFAAYPGLDEIEVRVRQHVLDRTTARVRAREEVRHRYRRDGAASGALSLPDRATLPTTPPR